MKKRGPKPKHGKGKPCVRKSISMPESLFEWCQLQAVLESMSASGFMVMVLQQAKLDYEEGGR